MSVIKSAIRRISSRDGAQVHTVCFVDSGSIKLASVRRAGARIVLEAAYSKQIAPTDTPETIATILNTDRQVLRRFSKTDITQLAHGAGVYCKIVDMPRMPMKEAASALKFTERDSAPLSLADSQTGVWEIGPNGVPGRMKVFMTAIDKNGAVSYRNEFRDAGLRLSRVSTFPAAVASLVRHSRVLNETAGTLVVNITGKDAGIYFFRNKTPLLLREIRGEAGETVSTWLDKLGKEVGRSLKYIRDTFQLTSEPSIFIIGAVAVANELAGQIEKAFGTLPKIYNPFDDFVSLSPGCAQTVKGRESEFAAIIGTAVDGQWSLKLAGLKSRPGIIPMFAGRNVWMTVGALAVALTLWVAGAQRMEEKIAILSANVAVLERDKNSRSAPKPELAGTRNMELARQTSARPAPPIVYDWSAIFSQIASMTPANTALTDLQISSAENDNRKPAPQRRGGYKRIKVRGLIRGSAVERISSLDHLLKSLSSSAILHSAAITATSEKSGKEESRFMTFEITARLNPATRKNLTADLTSGTDRKS